jgi:hypothetical protein
VPRPTITGLLLLAIQRGRAEGDEPERTRGDDRSGAGRRHGAPHGGGPDPVAPVGRRRWALAGDEEAFGSVKSMIMRRASNGAQVAVEDVERIAVIRLADW